MTQLDRPVAIAERVQRALCESARDFARYHMAHRPEAGAAFVDLDSGVAVFGGEHAGPNVGRCWGWGMAGPPSTADLDAAEAFYVERKHKIGFLVNPYADPALVEALQDRGYRHQRSDTVLIADVQALVGAAPDAGLRHVDLDDERDRALLVRGFREAYGVDGTAESIAAKSEALSQGNAASFVLEERGELLGLCAIWSAGGVAYLLGGGVLPSHRGRGLQIRLAHARLQWAAARGATLAVVATGPGTASELNMLRTGFRVAWSSAVWERAA
jgi:GNAT superfamily N-acetyltransferase